jgi:thermitase
MKGSNMKILRLLIIFAIILPLILPGKIFAYSDENNKKVDFAPAEIIVKFKPNVGPSEMALVHRKSGGQVKKTIPSLGVQIVNIPHGHVPDKVKAYSANPAISYAEPNYQCQVVGSPDDNYINLQWSLSNIKAPQAWDVTRGNRNINIAILDSGVDLDHPDLADKIVANANFSSSPTTDDLYGHGTHVAGIAAANTNNGIGIAGIGFDSTIMNVKVLGDNGSGFYTWVATGITWAADNGAEIINLSLGSTSYSITLENAVRYAWSKGVVVVAAAGNSGSSIPFYPAYYTDCLAVAATDINDNLPYWSTTGDWVDIAAPGVSILSTYKDKNYGYMSGTSMASPHAAGLAALLFSVVADSNGNGLLNDEVRDRIETTSDNLGISGIGSGRINAYRAVGGSPSPRGNIAGSVIDASNGSPIAGATLSDGMNSAVTDMNGNYIIPDIPGGNYSVSAFKEGFEISLNNVAVSPGQTATVDFYLIRTMASQEYMWVDSINFGCKGSNLFSHIKILGDSGTLAGADVRLTLTRSGIETWHFGGMTDDQGTVSFKLAKALGGEYLATVTNVIYSGYTWDQGKGTNSAEYSMIRETAKGKKPR